MKKIIPIIAILVLFAAGTAWAAPSKADNNPQIVANYPDGQHGIPGEPETHWGADTVMRAGLSGVFQQWFYGDSLQTDPGSPHGDHSVWMPSRDGTCPPNWVTMTVGQNNFWGDYLVDGGTYCIHTNDYRSSN